VRERADGGASGDRAGIVHNGIEYGLMAAELTRTAR
jgi:6-phosphogluconate dehydrogenase (decarboxylating)